MPLLAQLPNRSRRRSTAGGVARNNFVSLSAVGGVEHHCPKEGPMAKIFFSMSGEGRGHASRVHAVVEQLKQEHEISLFCPNDAYHLLEPRYRNSRVRVHE